MKSASIWVTSTVPERPGHHTPTYEDIECRQADPRRLLAVGQAKNQLGQGPALQLEVGESKGQAKLGRGQIRDMAAEIRGRMGRGVEKGDI